jgi:hypothetical protein
LYELGQGYYEKLFYSYFFVMKNLESGSGTRSGSAMNLNAGSGTPIETNADLQSQSSGSEHRTNLKSEQCGKSELS